MKLTDQHRPGIGASAVKWAAAVLVAGLLGGCAPGDTGLQRDAARQLQARVLEVTQASSQNDPAAALKALEGLEAELEAAQAKGQITEERRRTITTVATAVRADLDDAIAAAEQAAAEEAERNRVAAEAAAAEAAAAKAAAAQTPAPVPEPAPAPEPAPQDNRNNDDDDEGRGNGGKGNGND
jgi:hypothetical protein